MPQPGLSAIKKNDLHYKVGAIVPEQFKYQYPKPSSEAKQSEVERRKLKNEKARESKRTKQEKIEAANIRPTVRDIMKRMLIKLEKGIIGSKTTTRRKQVCTTEPRKKIKKTKDPAAPKGKRKAYDFFRAKMRPILKVEGLTVTEKLLGERWRALAGKEKEEYNELAVQDALRYDQQMLEYNLKNQAENVNLSEENEQGYIC